jgi:uncharacterized SAM-binding protein YcdF (DUF218 family)
VRAGPLERADDVDALPSAREEDAVHGRRGYRRPVLRRALLVLGLLVVAWVVVCSVLFVWPPAESGAPQRADAVVVLAGGLNARLDPALALMRRRVAPVLVVSGAFHGHRWPKAERLCSGAYAPLRYRVICSRPRPYSTRGEARMIDRLARAHGWDEVVVVTSTFHVTRAHMLVRRCYDGGLAFVGTHTPWWRLPQEFATETGKLAVQLTVKRGC